MTVAGRRPPSRWSWSIAFGALTMVSRSGISRWYLPADAVRRSARSAEPFAGGGERGGDPPRSRPTDDVARRERAVDRGGVTECVSDAGVPRECHGYGVAAPAQRTSDHRVRGGVERDAGTDAMITSALGGRDRKSTRLNSSHMSISYAVFCLKKKIIKIHTH